VNFSQYVRSDFLVSKSSTFERWEDFPSSYCGVNHAIYRPIRIKTSNNDRYDQNKQIIMCNTVKQSLLYRAVYVEM